MVIKILHAIWRLRKQGDSIMSRMVGTVSRGVRAPIIRHGDDLVEIVTKFT